MKNPHTIMKICLILLILIFLVGCSNSGSNSLVGQWEIVSLSAPEMSSAQISEIEAGLEADRHRYNMILHFYADGTGVYIVLEGRWGSDESPFEWTADRTHLTITNHQGPTHTLDYRISSNRLTIYNFEDDFNFIFRRVD